MRILCLDVEALGLDFVLRCAAEGHEVRWWRYQKRPTKDGQGFHGFKIVDDWRPSMPWAKDGLIVTTGNWKLTAELDRFRDLGFNIFGPTKASADLEIVRETGLEAMKAAGIEVPRYETFPSLEAAEKFARKHDDCCWVHKPMGSEEDKSLTYVGSDPADMVGWLQRQIARGAKVKGKVMLQERIDMLCELGVSGWFGPAGFLPDKWQVCIEHKKLCDGEIGPATGEQGTVCQYVEADKLATEMLLPMVGALRKAGHRGDFAVGAGIDTKGKAWPFEFTSRLGWPAFYIQVASHKGDPAQWMLDLLNGKDTLKVSRDVALGVVVSQPRYPYNCSPPELVEGVPISGYEDVMDDLHPASVMLGKGPRMAKGAIVDGPTFQTTGEYVLCATGLGATIEQARKRVYRTVDAIKFPDMIYRRDIGEKVQKALPKLHGMGYLKEMRP